MYVHDRAKAAVLNALIVLDCPISEEKLAERINYSHVHTKRIIKALRLEGLIETLSVPGCHAHAYHVDQSEAAERGLLP